MVEAGSATAETLAESAEEPGSSDLVKERQPVTLPRTVQESPSSDLERVRSRERAVSRVSKGVGVSVVGWLGMVAVPVADFVFGASQLTQEVWSIAARSAVWLGIFVAASAGTHILRFGGKRGKLAFASLAAAGGCGMLAVAEQFETWFLDTQFLRGLDVWGLAGALVFFVLAIALLTADTQGHGLSEDGEC